MEDRWIQRGYAILWKRDKNVIQYGRDILRDIQQLRLIIDGVKAHKYTLSC
jgi:hypothetical protein